MLLSEFCRRRSFISGALGVLLLAALGCGPQQPEVESSSGSKNGGETEESVAPALTGSAAEPLLVGAIPDQDPEKLQRLYGKLSDYLSAELGVPVEYRPVTDYAAAVTAFRVGDLDLVWFGGLTGVQARLQVPDADAIAQRDIDAEFHSIFIANQSSGLTPIKTAAELTSLKGKTFTFGSESSTSGRLMPQYFLAQAGVGLSDFKGEPGFPALTMPP